MVCIHPGVVIMGILRCGRKVWGVVVWIWGLVLWVWL